MLAYAVTLALASADGGHEVLALLDRQAAAWTRGDLDAFCSVYAADAVFVAPSGVTRGREQVLARYKKKYPTAAAMGKLTLTPVDVRETADAVSVAAKWTLEYPNQPSSTGHTVVVFKRWQGRWQIVHDASL